MYKISIILLLSLLACKTFAKDVNWPEINKYLSRVYQDDEITNIIEILEYYFDNPITLYNAKEDALTVLPTIELATSRAIIQRFKQNPEISEIELFDGLLLDEAQMQIILNATSRQEQANMKNTYASYYLRNEERFEIVRGLREKKYLGDKYDIYQRLQFRYKDLQFQALGNKNLGEVHLLEFVSAGAKYGMQDLKIIMGDFNTSFGCGNILWQDFSLGKGSDFVSSPKPYSSNIKLNTSISPNGFFRGVALEKILHLGVHNLTSSVFLSNIARPANVDTINNIATSIYTNNYFRTQTEINKKDALKEFAIGANFVYNYKNYTFGFTYFEVKYDYPLKSSSSRAFNGAYSNLFSVFSFINLKNISLGTEYSFYENKFPALKLFWSIKFKNFEIVQHYRNYHAKYRSFFGYNFGESSIPANEEGIYNGLRAKFDKNLTSEAYLDFYRTHKRTYSVEKPVKGVDYAIIQKYRNKFLGEFFLKIKSEAKTDGFKPKGATNQTVYILKRNDIRFEFEREITRNLSSAVRFDATDVYFEQKKPCENGTAGFLELNYKIINNLSITCRLSIFRTDSYSSAIWHYEYRMPTSVFSNALYDEGSRLLLRFSYKLFEQFQLYCAYTRLEKPKLEKLGSSYDQINSDKDNRLYFLLNLKL